MTISNLKIAPRSEWTDTKPKRTALSWDAVKYVVIHWPGTPGKKIGTNIGALLRGWYTYHVKDRGWTDIAYNYAVDQTGKIWTLRGDYRDGATSGWGGRSVSILAVLANSETPSEAMLKSLKTLALQLQAQASTGCKIVGHRDLISTTCPGDTIAAWIKAGLPVTSVPNPAASATFTFATMNREAERFGGLDDQSLAPGRYMKDKIRASIYTLSEVSETARDSIKKTLKHFKSYATAYVAVFWDGKKYRHSDVADVKWTAYHGAIRVRLTHNATGRVVNVIAIHVPPAVHWAGKSDSYIVDAKRELIRNALTKLHQPGYPTILAGDFNLTDAVDPIANSFGLGLLSDNLPTHKGKAIDRIYGSHIRTTDPRIIRPPSDHAGIRITVTLNPTT